MSKPLLILIPETEQAECEIIRGEQPDLVTLEIAMRTAVSMMKENVIKKRFESRALPGMQGHLLSNLKLAVENKVLGIVFHCHIRITFFKSGEEKRDYFRFILQYASPVN